jgi:ATP-dependent DNA ligase
MQRFALLLDTLSTTPSRNGKLSLLCRYFRDTPDPARGYALAALTDGVLPRLPLRRLLIEIMPGRIDPVLYDMSRDFVGDTAETVALMWPTTSERETDPPLHFVVTAFESTPRERLGELLAATLDRLDVRGRWALLKLIGGAPRVGVSARLAKQALADMSGHSVGDIEEVWHAVEKPYLDLFAWLEGREPKPTLEHKPVFRPLMLAHPIEEGDWANLAADDVSAEWKWDGIRVQIATTGGTARLFSRTGDEVTGSFPEIVASFAVVPGPTVLDGELLVLRNGIVAPFNDLQQRLNRKVVTPRMMRDYPAHVRLYDLLIDAGDDLRELPFVERRARLEAWHTRVHPPLSDVSALVSFADFDELRSIWAGTREAGIEGLMLKRRASPYLAGRPKGHWFKWKRAALTLDCVIMYAQRGSGKRSSYYSDYTFGVWREADPDRAAPVIGEDIYPDHELVPVGKAYSGFTDEELTLLDRFIRTHTREQFGPVRAVEPKLVLEVAFDAIFPSSRHKSGIAMRFPRIHRIRWDKPATEADTLAAAKALITAQSEAPEAEAEPPELQPSLFSR